MALSYKQMFEIARSAGLLTAEQIARATNESDDRSPLAVAEELGYATESQIARAVASKYRYEYIDIAAIDIDPQAAMSIPIEVILRNRMLPIARDEDTIRLAMIDPSDILARDDVRMLTRLRIDVVVASESDLLAAIDRFVAEAESLDNMTDGFGVEEDDDESIEDTDEDSVVAKLTNKVISDAINIGAGDIYLEPRTEEMVVRFRVDGVCREIFRAPKTIQRQLVNRLKITCDLDIAEKRKPQDGRFGVNMNGKVVDFRVAFLPTIHGELVVMRLLRRDSILLSLTDLGFLDHNFALLREALDRPHGAILVTGPTGSGKSTTLYAAINETSDSKTNLITVEDPVEYRLPGLSQVQVHEKAGLTFASALRSILRQDPDKVMIGEIRDTETGKIAIEAALTGHLVLSTLHTNNAPAALTRLTEMGIEPFLSASAISLVVAQRLARRLCPDCKVAYTPTVEELDSVEFPYEPGKPLPVIYKPKGCGKCNEIGYKGRMGIHEVMKVSEEIERLIVRNATADDLRHAAVAQGMLLLRQDGFAKVAMGLTSIEEVLRVVV